MILESWEHYMLMDAKGAGGGTPAKEEKKELSPLDKIQQVVDAKKAKVKKEGIAEILDLPTPPEDEKKEEVEEKKEEKKEEKVEEKAEDKKEEEEKKEEVEEEKEEVDDPLVVELARISAEAAGHETEIQGEPEKKEVEKKEEVKKESPTDLMTPVDTKDVDYVGKDTMGETFDEKDVGAMNTVLNKVVKESNKRARTQAFQDVLKVVPQIVDNIVKGHMAAMEYWRKNPALEKLANKHAGLRDFVAIKANEIQKKNPKFTLGQVYNQVDKEVRGILGNRLKEKEEGKVDSEDKKKKEVKTIPRKPGSSRPIPKIPDKTEGKSQQDQMGKLSDFIHGG